MIRTPHRRRVLRWWLAAALLLVSAAALAWMQAPGAGAPLTNFLPADALLVLEAKNFHSLLRDWNGSQVQALWLESANYEAFERSKLFLRLAEDHQEFAAAAGVPVQMDLLESLAGGESALALYDIGELRFLYVTRMEQARLVENALWRSRAEFEPRRVGERTYYVRSDRSSGRTAAFAASEGLLFVATGAERLAAALQLLGGEPLPSISEAAWYRDPVGESEGRGDLRLALDMAVLARNPYFRSYWVQRNVSEMRAYRAAVIDLHRSAGELREKRVFLRSAPAEESAAPAAGLGAALFRAAPAEATLRQLWSPASPGQAAEAIRGKIAAAGSRETARAAGAPAITMASGQVGHEGLLETRIDIAPPRFEPGVFDAAPIAGLLGANAPLAMLVAQRTRQQSSSGFLSTSALVAVGGADGWEIAAARDALRQASAGLWSASGHGTQWAERGAFFELDGLTPLQIAARGPLLLFANDSALMRSALDRLAEAPTDAADARYWALFRHQEERQPSLRLLGHLDFLRTGGFPDRSGRAPAFFSENAGSLSQALRRVEQVSVERKDDPVVARFEVIYRLGP